MGFFLLSLLVLPLATHAQPLTGNGYATSTSTDVGNNVTTGTFIPTAVNTCSSTCSAAFKAMRLSAFNGTCDLCASNTGNSSIASWGPSSGNCTACANTWNNYTAACTGATNKACFNYNVIGNGNARDSFANILAQSAGAGNAGDVYDFLSTYTQTLATCSDVFNYLVSYALTVNNDPLYPATATGSDCPLVGASNLTCSAACNNDWQLLALFCQNQQLIQYDYFGLPGVTAGSVVAAQPGTFLPAEIAIIYLLNGTALGPYNNNTNTGTGRTGYALNDPSCVASQWVKVFQDGNTGIGLSTTTDAVAPANLTQLGAGYGINAAAAVIPPIPANITCLQAAARMNTSVAPGGNCDSCLSDTGSANGCFANCPACASDFTAYTDACGAAGDATLQPTFALASYWVAQLQSVVGNFSYGDCYLNMVQNIMTPLAAQCSDYIASMVLSTENIYNVQPNPNGSATNSNGPNCPTNAADSAFKPGTCPGGCQADLALLSGCYSSSTINIPLLGVSNMPFPTAWMMFVNGSLFGNGVQNSLTTLPASFNLTGCASTLSTYVPGVFANGTVSSALPSAAPNCSVARATLAASTNNGACDQCSSNTGIPGNCFTNDVGDPDCTACGVQYDNYVNACNETYNDLGNTFAGNLYQTTAGGTGGDCFDEFNLAAQSLIGTPGFDIDPCSDTWDSIVQYSETVWNDPSDATPGPNCPVIPNSNCTTACQNDLQQLNTFCTNTSVVQWAGFGIGFAANGSAIVAPAGYNVSIATAWALFANGTATAPIGNSVVKGGAPIAVPFALGKCTLPTWVPTTGPGSAASFAPATVNGSFSINLFSTTPQQLYTANTGKALEATIAKSLSVPVNAITIQWAQLGVVSAAGRRHLLAATTIPYTVTTTQAAAAAVSAAVATFNPATALASTISNTLNLTSVTVAAPPPPPPSPPPPSPPPMSSAAVQMAALKSSLAAALLVATVATMV